MKAFGNGKGGKAPAKAFKKGGSIPLPTVAKIAMLSNMAGKREAGGPLVRPAKAAPVAMPAQSPAGGPPGGLPGMKKGGKVKWTDASDDKMDKKAGIKEGSKKDMAIDKKRGVPENDMKRGGKVKSKKK